MAQPTMLPGSGYYATAEIWPTGATAGIEIPVRNWGLANSVRITPDTNSQSGPYPIQVQSYLGATVTFDMTRNYTAGQNPYGTVLSISSGTILSTLWLYEAQTPTRGALNGPAHTLTNVLIHQVGANANVASGAANSVRWAGVVSGPTGTYSPPTT